MSCIEKRQHKNHEEQERLLRAWAGENNVKQCPSCQAWVEKVEGCHHINCRCGVHFCWICAGVFDANSIYDHMTRVHGNWYNDPGHGRRQAEAGGQPREQVPNIVQIAGDQVAVAEQAAELRRLELLRRNRATRPIINQGANLLNPQPARHEGWRARIGLHDQGRPQTEADEQRRTPEEFEQVRRQQQAREEQMRCQQQAREEQMRCQQKAREEQMRREQQAREEQMRREQQAREEQMRCQQQAREEQMQCQQKAREEQMRCQQQAHEEQMRRLQQARGEQMRREAREAEENKWCVVM